MESRDKVGTLALQGSLTVNRIDQIHAEVLAGLSTHQQVVLDCDSAEDVDITFLQLLISTNHAAEALGKAVRLRSPPQGALAKALTRCGFVSSPTTSLAQALTSHIRAQS
jgi:anti-anti-sigma regulatory factor